MSVSLGQLFEEFIKQQVQSGFYNSKSEVIRTALRLLIQRDQAEQQKEQIQESPEEIRRIRALIQEGEDSGEFKEWTDETMNEIIEGGKKILFQKYGKKVD